MTTFNEYVGKEIRSARMAKGMSQRELSERLGIKRGAYSQYETGKNTMSLETWFKLARILDLDPDEIPMKALKISSR
jgi:transcriptional regulator with XRE-family HTH domain